MTPSPSSPPQRRREHLAVDGRVLSDEYHGIGRLAEMVLRRLAGTTEFDVTVFVRPGQTSQRFDIDGLIEGLGYRRALFDLPLTSSMQWARWPGVLRRAGATVTLSLYSLGGPVIGGGRRCTFVHDCIMETDARFAPDRRTRLLYMLHTALMVRGNRVFTRSAASARDIERFYRVPVPDWQVVPGGVDDTFAHGAEPVGQIGGQRLPATYLLQVGARRPHKNVAALVRVLPHLPEDYHLVLVGTVDDRFPDEVPALAGELGVAGRIVHLPRVSEPELHSLYAGAAAFVYPSLIEGLGLPLLEAMAAGLPVVAGDIPVFREIAEDAAVLVPSDEPQAWADAILSLRSPEVREALVAAGRRQVKKNTWDVTASRMLEALRRM
ncbi:glycosyltransferase family 1 protein [Actinoplanes sp. M2I2]|uniref:glycosyltransferase family 4 protein n=1 Tax=Actinoplanes sp. M2I2 TaxID=1734444 RepID=UPI00201FB8DC|nr:glycosyltransferase family 1 protein [Actinoplanes sp. M2I2]